MQITEANPRGNKEKETKDFTKQKAKGQKENVWH